MINITQDEIMQSWDLKNFFAPKVSIWCLAFNHELYIEQALDSFLVQKTIFPFEIVVHDDASMDKTAELIRKYQKKYPAILKPIYETENIWSKQDGTLDRIVYSSCKGEYIAYCEGDDYWIDENKLQRQVDFLDLHQDYSLSSENGNILFTFNNETRVFNNEKEHDVSFADLLIRRRFPTASVVCRKFLLEDYNKIPGVSFDTKLWAYLSTKGKVHFNPIISSVYRRGSGVTENDKIKWVFIVESFCKTLEDNFKIPLYIKIIRNKNLFEDYKQALIISKKNDDKEMLKCILGKMIKLGPLFFIIDFSLVVINSLKKMIKKLLWIC